MRGPEFDAAVRSFSYKDSFAFEIPGMSLLTPGSMTASMLSFVYNMFTSEWRRSNPVEEQRHRLSMLASSMIVVSSVLMCLGFVVAHDMSSSSQPL